MFFNSRMQVLFYTIYYRKLLPSSVSNMITETIITDLQIRMTLIRIRIQALNKIRIRIQVWEKSGSGSRLGKKPRSGSRSRLGEKNQDPDPDPGLEKIRI